VYVYVLYTSVYVYTYYKSNWKFYKIGMWNIPGYKTLFSVNRLHTYLIDFNASMNIQYQVYTVIQYQFVTCHMFYYLCTFNIDNSRWIDERCIFFII